VIIVDTNVVSEPLWPEPEPAVLAWLDAQAPETLHLTSMTLAKLLAGVAALPAGRRRTKLSQALTEQVLPLFEGRVLAFDMPGAHDGSLIAAWSGVTACAATRAVFAWRQSGSSHASWCSAHWRVHQRLHPDWLDGMAVQVGSLARWRSPRPVGGG
jgi:hypothetical protein